MSNPTLAEMSGETNRAPRLTLNEIGINGKTGNFVYRDMLGGLKEVPGKPDKKAYDEKDLGSEIDVVFLKIRRRLKQFRKGMKNLQTNEHDHKKDFVTLYGLETGVIQGTGEELRELHDGLRTTQVIYGLYKGELVRIIIKGASLGSENKKKDTADFYSYISSFKNDGREDHFYEYFTTLKGIEESGDLGSYYCATYIQGEKLSDEQMTKVADQMLIAFNYSKEVDEFFEKDKMRNPNGTEKVNNNLPVSGGGEPASPKIGDTGIDYPEEEINEEDIPF